MTLLMASFLRLLLDGEQMLGTMLLAWAMHLLHLEKPLLFLIVKLRLLLLPRLSNCQTFHQQTQQEQFIAKLTLVNKYCKYKDNCSL